MNINEWPGVAEETGRESDRQRIRFFKNLIKNKNTNILIRITQAPENITGALHKKK